MELVVLIRESVKVVRIGAAAAPGFFFSHPDLDNGEFYAAKRYIHVLQEGDKEYLFDFPFMRRALQSIIAQVNKERV